MDVIPETRFRH